LSHREAAAQNRKDHEDSKASKKEEMRHEDERRVR
jgi:hypothetical protein